MGRAMWALWGVFDCRGIRSAGGTGRNALPRSAFSLSISFLDRMEKAVSVRRKDEEMMFSLSRKVLQEPFRVIVCSSRNKPSGFIAASSGAVSVFDSVSVFFGGSYF